VACTIQRCRPLVRAQEKRESGLFAFACRAGARPAPAPQPMRLVRAGNTPKGPPICRGSGRRSSRNISRPRFVRLRMLCRRSLFDACLVTRPWPKLFSMRLSNPRSKPSSLSELGRRRVVTLRKLVKGPAFAQRQRLPSSTAFKTTDLAGVEPVEPPTARTPPALPALSSATPCCLYHGKLRLCQPSLQRRC